MRLALRLNPPQQFPSEHEFDERGGVIGRSSECDWVLACPHKLISRRHAVILFEQNRFWLYDASANGVFHNGSAEPIGTGWRVPVEHGDSFRLGEFVIEASLIEADERPAVPLAAPPEAQPVVVVAPEPPPVQPPLATAELSDRFHAPTTAAPVSFMDTQDVFEPPRATIPEDWDLPVELAGDGPREAPTVAVSRRLSGAESAASRALWEALLPEAAGEIEQELTPETARVLGRCLRTAVESLLALRAEFAEVERELAPGKGQADEIDGLGEAVQPEAFCRDLVFDPFAEDRVDGLARAAQALQGRHARVAQAFSRSLETIIEQFAPEKFDKRWEQSRAADAARNPAARVKEKIAKHAGFQSFYRAWHEEQQANGYRAVHQLFEKKFLSIYLHRPKGKLEPERAPERLPQEA